MEEMEKRMILQYDTITENHVPVILCHSQDAVKAPMVLLNHGTTGSAEGLLDMGVALARRGCFCVLIDAVWHGRRADSRLHTMLTTSLYKRYYLDMLLLMAEDMGKIIDYYTGNPSVDTARVGMTGISQGGYVAYMTMTKDARIKAAAPLVGSPDLEDKYGNSQEWEIIDEETQKYVLSHSPLRHYEKMAGTALLIQNSAEDTVVPVGGVRRLDRKLRPLYDDKGNYQYIEYFGIGHEVTPDMKRRAIDWLAEKL